VSGWFILAWRWNRAKRLQRSRMRSGGSSE
jgi:CDP-diacylglycerol--serine O-phosphatidyltransferase